jgi:hypothetical protein
MKREKQKEREGKDLQVWSRGVAEKKKIEVRI